KGKVTRRKHHRLCKLNIHIMYVRQIAYTSCNGNITFVFDSSGLSTMPHSRIAILRIGQKRNKQYCHSFVCQKSAEFREFYVITNQDSYFSAIGIKNL